MAYTPETVLGIVKARLNRLADDNTIDEYLDKRIEAADQEMTRKGVTLVAEDAEDQMLLADIVVWQYQNRDKPGYMPNWLDLRIRERWLNQQNAT